MKLRKIIQTSVAALMLVFALATPLVMSTGPVAQATAPTQIGKGLNQANPGASTNLPTFIKNAVNILLFAVGVAAVVLIIIGGIRYVTSAGDSNAISGAKNTILYAIVGLIVAAAAFAIVNFVVTNI